MIKKLSIVLFCCLGLSTTLGEGVKKTVAKDSQVLKAPSLKSVLAFARDLEKQKDYYRAITEYKRQLFLATDQNTRSKCYLAIVRCYYEGHKWMALHEACQNALRLDIFTKDEKNSLLKVNALALWNLGLNYKAYKLVEKVNDNKVNSAQLKAWTSFAAGNEKQAQKYFEQAKQLHYSKTIQNYQADQKSPALAGSLSALIPGAGQLYCGETSAAIGAFMVNALLIASTIEAFDEDQEALGTGLGILATGFYAGNIYGAVNFAHRHNAEKRDDWLAKKEGLAGKYKESVILKIIVPF